MTKRVTGSARARIALHVAALISLWTCIATVLRSRDIGWTFLLSDVAAMALAASAFACRFLGLARLAVLAAALLGPLGLVELAAPPGRCLLARWSAPEYPREEFRESFYDSDPELGRIPKPNANVVHVSWAAPNKAAWQVTYRTDQERRRLVVNRPESGPAVLLFGCSYTFGHALEDDQTIASRLQERLPDRRVYNYGVNAYSSAQALFRLRRAEHEAVDWVWYFCIDPHFTRNAGDWSWRRRYAEAPLLTIDERLGFPNLVRRAQWPARLLPGSRESFLHRFLNGRSVLYEHGPSLFDMSDAAKIRLTAAIVENMRTVSIEMTSESERFVVAFLPIRSAELTSRQQTLLADLAARGVTCVDFAAPLQRELAARGAEAAAMYDQTSGHPTPELADLIAGWCAEFMNRGAAHSRGPH